MSHRRLSFLLGAVLPVLGMLAGAALGADAPMEKMPVPQGAHILTPAPGASPRITGPRIYGERVGKPFLYSIPATGDEPIKFAAQGLPDGLQLDPATGHITGSCNAKGDYKVHITATNDKGTDQMTLQVVIGDQICLTPPLGWNSWNCFAGAVDDAKVRAAADAMVSSGLIHHGWTYINIDDTWESAQRDDKGFISGNKKFPDMKALADYVHSRGLKIGLYSSPGPTTCAGFLASYQHEQQDAQTYAKWGFDYLKYDWCSYGGIADKLVKADPALKGLPILKRPYQMMDSRLHEVDRDIVFSLCQYGMGDVWKWGASVGGNCWRTTGDISDNWNSMSSIGFGQNGHEKYAGPGHWNDPDMLVVGYVGWGHLHPTHLTPDEQYTHITLWSLLSAPLLIGCDMTRMDDFTRSLLTNDEVLAVNQDALGKPAGRIVEDVEHGGEIWARPLADGTMAVGIFNRGRYVYQPFRKNNRNPSARAVWRIYDRYEKKAQEFDSEQAAKEAYKALCGPSQIIVKWSDLKLNGKQKVRDLWSQKDAGEFPDQFSVTVPFHGAALIKVGTPK